MTLQQNATVHRAKWELLDNQTLVIGLGHKARHGKDWLAQRIHSFSPQHTKIYHFSDDLKGWCRIQGYMTAKHGPVLQAAGMFIRQMQHDMFVRCMEYRLLEEAPEVALIPDVRFLNEKEWIEDHGISVRVTRMENGHVYVADDRPSQHISEQELEKALFDWDVVAESGDLAALDTAAWRIWREAYKLRFGRDIDISLFK